MLTKYKKWTIINISSLTETKQIPFYNFQCFCFEEQRLNPQEEVDMPVFFYIDPEFAEDPRMVNVDLITLSYTFFEAKEGQQLPVPGYN